MKLNESIKELLQDADKLDRKWKRFKIFAIFFIIGMLVMAYFTYQVHLDYHTCDHDPIWCSALWCEDSLYYEVFRR